MRISRRVQSLVGFTAMAVVIMASILWNVVLREKVTTIRVYTLREPVHEGDLITADNITLRFMDRNDVLPEAIRTENDAAIVMTLAARQYIPAGVQLVAGYFESPALMLAEGEYIFSVPDSWLVAVPGTLRRKDAVKLYAITTGDVERLMNRMQSIAGTEEDGLVSTTEIQPPSDTGDTTAVPALTPTPVPDTDTITTSLPTLSPLQTSSSPQEPTPTASGWSDILDLAIGSEYHLEARVAYVRDKSNQEVVDAATAQMERLNGSSNIYRVEIIATEEMIATMTKAVAAGYRYIVLYH